MEEKAIVEFGHFKKIIRITLGTSTLAELRNKISLAFCQCSGFAGDDFCLQYFDEDVEDYVDLDVISDLVSSLDKKMKIFYASPIVTSPANTVTEPIEADKDRESDHVVEKDIHRSLVSDGLNDVLRVVEESNSISGGTLAPRYIIVYWD